MTVILDNANHPNIEYILDFWHKCEFFLPFELQRAVLDVKKEDKWSIKSLGLSELPQNNTSIWNFSPPPEKEIVGFDIYIGVFDKSEIANRVQKVLGVSEGLEAIEEDELRKLEGPTCMARIGVDNNGAPIFSSVAISTVSWALGSCRENLSLDKLDIDNFEDDVRWLKQSLLEFNHDMPSDSESGQPTPLSGSDLLRLLEIFVSWSKEWPGPVSQTFSKGPALVIKAKTAKPRKQAFVGNKENSARTLSEGRDETDEEEVVDPHPQSDADIDILNSFYARDIARVIRSIKQGSKAGLVSAYLAKPDIQKRVDLYTSKGLQKIMEGLEPSKLPAAHWPSDPMHAMSLMQQFALNTLLGTLQDGDIFSINGPPGTGKTTLLRDIFSELMTRRARVLSRLTRAKDAFQKKTKVDFDNGQETSTLNLLNDDLTGYEMVVVSSNNAAVENLSKDIPKASAIGEFWRAEGNDAPVSYLQQVAHNIASRRSDGKYEKLKTDDIPWGLFAAALGRSQNRRHFQSGLQFDGTPAGKSQECKLPPNYDPDFQQSIWNWRKKHKSISFETARKAFIKADNAVAERIAYLEDYKKLHTPESNLSEEDFCLPLQQAFDRATLEYNDVLMEFNSIKYRLNQAEAQLKTLAQQEELILTTSPQGFFEKLFKKEEKKKCDKALSDTRNLKKEELKKIYDLRNNLEEARSKLTTIESSVTTTRDNLTEGQVSWRETQDELHKFRQLFPSIRFPSDEVDLEQDNWQTDGLWYDANLNRLRSQLFAAAMTLHEEWLYEVTQNNGGFGGNLVAITKLLGGGRLSNPKEDALPIWQSLFMVVPVISSTFASIATQFRDLGESSLGWLFVDEAGQAIPQAAVGALWRSKHAVVVGDPMQIEPVFTVPPKLVSLLAQHSGLNSPDPEVPIFSPSHTSVQVLADRINATGAYIENNGTKQWVGCPLRVHRRCADPMFSIANSIAYNGKMVFHGYNKPESRLPPANSFDLGQSSWITLDGSTSDHQVVTEQIDFTLKAVREVLHLTGDLPDFYIISPFRRIKTALIETLGNLDNWEMGSSNYLPKTALTKWCRERIGTVHTFQGKEESTVLMVLGCDKATAGAAQWAASKPNLLNVALTRAKHRFFMIGDPEIWGGLPHFSVASEQDLPRITPKEFMRRIEIACEKENAG